MISFKHSGNFKSIERFFNKAQKLNVIKTMQKCGEEGVRQLAASTPVDSGSTAASWGYTIDMTPGAYKITWTNSNAPYGSPVALLIQYGHATKSGTYVQGIDYINPALAKTFDRFGDDVWKEITRL